MPEAARTFPAALHNVGEARRFLTRSLGTWAVEGYDFGGPLVLTELATNAILHAGTAFEVRISSQDGGLRVQVQDGSARCPRRRDYGSDATTGRGMNLVTALCEEWGTTGAGSGKVVWALLRPDEPDEVLGGFDLDEEAFPLHSVPAAPVPGRAGGQVSSPQRGAA